MSIEQRGAELEHPSSVVKQLANHTLWVCFLNPEGFETFARAVYDGDEMQLESGMPIPKNAEVSTIQFRQEGTQVTVLPTGHAEDGTPLFQTVEMLVDAGELPEFTARSLARRIKRQPYRKDPKVAIFPLLPLIPPEVLAEA